MSQALGQIIPSGDYHAVDPAPVILQTNGATALELFVNMTAVVGAGNTVTVNIDEYDEASGGWATIGGVALTSGVQEFVVSVDPRVTTAAVANNIQRELAEQIRVRPVGSGTRTTLNYSVAASLTS